MPNGTVIEVRSGHLPDGSFVQTFTDITKRCEAEAHVARLASEDPLTGLPNRRVFRAALDQVSRRQRVTDGVRQAGRIRRAVPRSRPLQGRQRHARSSDRRPAPAGGRQAAEGRAAADRRARAARRRRIRHRRADVRIPRRARSAGEPVSPKWSASPTRSTATASGPASASASRSGRTTATMPTICSWRPILRSTRSRRPAAARYRFYQKSMNEEINDRRQIEMDLREAIEQQRARTALSADHRPAAQRHYRASRRWRDGAIRSRAWCRRRCSSRWPKTAGSSCRSANGRCGRPAAMPRNGRTISRSRSISRPCSSRRPICST